MLSAKLAKKAPKDVVEAEKPNPVLLELFSKPSVQSEQEKKPNAMKQLKQSLAALQEAKAAASGSTEETKDKKKTKPEKKSKKPTNNKPEQKATEDSKQTDEEQEQLKKEREAAELEKNKRTVFVGNLSTASTTKEIKKLFSQFGNVESVRFRSIAVSSPKYSQKVAFYKSSFSDKLDDIHAYVVFKSEEEANKALSLNSQVHNERHLRVDLACKPKDVKFDKSSSVFVGNLPYDIDDEALWNHFSQCGTVSAVRVIRDAQYRIGKGFAYVLFDTPLAIRHALQLNDSTLLGRKIRVTRVAKQQKQTKQFNSKPKGFPQSKRKNLNPIAKKESFKPTSKPRPNFEGKRANPTKKPRLVLSKAQKAKQSKPTRKKVVKKRNNK